jgi:hypothetical protein
MSPGVEPLEDPPADPVVDLLGDPLGDNLGIPWRDPLVGDPMGGPSAWTCSGAPILLRKAEAAETAAKDRPMARVAETEAAKTDSQPESLPEAE